ncbi:MAG: hypothetical protein KDD89_03160, partial [Anaerolineales bacterium]|nr:hypothetical protein [Anaerolineales bacterium]
MSYASPVYRFVSSLLSLLLVLQSVAPALFYPPTAVAQPTQPASTRIEAEADLTPLTIARVQSSYQAGNTAVVTYTLRNNLSARNYPQIAPGLTVTDTVAALADFDPLADPNTLRNIVVRHELTNGATLLSASVLPAGEGEQTLYHLGDLAPLADAVLTMTVQLPPTAVDFTTLDNGGATAYATHHGREVTARAHPLRLAPDNFAPWLISTPDAALQDTAMLLQAARIGDDPLDLFAHVQTFAYHAYEGSLRGTRGTLWSEAGNSVDQSSLLIALLRSAGYPARYRHGTLPTAEAQTLIASMFPQPTAVRGTVPPSAETSDPLNDPDLLALAQDHWWVEAYLPGQGWTTLDPTVGTSGTTPATPLGDSTDQIAELPASLRHMLHFTLDVEQYSDFPLGGLNLQTNTVLTASVPSAQTAGTPVSLGFAVDSETVSGLVTATTLHTYSPYLVYGEPETTLYGTAVEDILTTFPLATRYTTAVWLEVTSTAPNGQSDTYRRTIKDLIGADGRLGGAVQLPARDNSPLLSTSDLMQVQPIPNSGYPAEEAARQFNAIYQQTPAMVAAFEAYAEINEESDEATITEFVNDQLGAVYTAQFAQLDLMTALFQFGTTWEGRPIRPETTLVTSYPSQPKLILTSQVVSAEGTLDTTFELLNIAEKAIAYPGQNQEAVKSANFLRTTAEKSLEYELLTLFLPGNDVRSAVAVMTAAGEQNIPTRFIVAENLAELDDLAIPELTKAHIAGYAQEGALIWVPEQMVPMPYGEDIGFMVVAPDGSATYINADGFAASALVTYVTKLKTIAITALIEGTGLGFVGGFIGYIFSFFAEVFIASLSLPPTDPGEYIGGVASGEAGDASGKGTLIGLILAAKAAIPVPITACGASPNVGACQAGVMAGYGFVVAALVGGLAGGALDPSLTDFWVADLPELESATAVSFTHTTAPTLPAGTVTLNLSAAHHYASAPTLSSSWTGNGTQTADFDTLTATTAVLTQNGTTLGNGNLSASDGAAQWAGNGRAWTVNSGNGSASLASYSANTAGLTLSASGVYTAVVASSATAQTAQLRTSQAILNDSDQFSGDFSATISSDLALSGQGTVPVPASATNHSYTLGAGQLMLSGLGAGSLTVGNTAVDTSNAQAIALADYSGDVALASGNPRDQISLSGTADLFTFGVSSEQSSLPANQSTRLLTNIQANYNDSYRITVYVPDGWQVGRDGFAQTIITPTAKAALGTATLLITAESTQYPGLFASATLAVEVTPSTGIGLSVTPDPLFTVPMGVVQGTAYADPLTLNHAGDGRAEVPGAAFNVRLQNQATTAVSFDLTTSGLPAGWAVWSQAPQPRLDLAPGAAQTVGLYVVPPEGPLLSADSAFPFTVTAVDTSNPANTTTANAVFTMPALPFPYLTADPLLQTVAPGQPVTVSLRVQNVGNTAASFPITASVRAGHFSTAVVSPTLLTSPTNFETGSLASNAIFETNLLLDTSTAVPGTTYFVQAQSVAGEYDPTALTAVQVASLLTAPLVETAACVADPLATATTNLGAVITTLEGACADGNCPPSGRTDLLNAVDSYVGTLVKVGFGFEADTSAVTAVRDDIAAAETTAELTATFAPLVTAV